MVGIGYGKKGKVVLGVNWIEVNFREKKIYVSVHVVIKIRKGYDL